jgi:hypothetical protein
MRPAKEVALEIGKKLVAAHRRSGFIEATSVIAPAIEARDRELVEAAAKLVEDAPLGSRQAHVIRIRALIPKEDSRG